MSTEHEDYGGMAGFDWKTPRYEAAESELRKLVAEREADRAAMRRALEALKYHTEQTRPIVASQVAIHDLRQRLEGTT